MKNLIYLIIGLAIGASSTFWILESKGLVEGGIESISKENQLEVMKLRKEISDSLKRNDRVLLRTRGRRISADSAKIMTEKWIQLRDKLHEKSPILIGTFLGAGVGFGLDSINSLIDHINKENRRIDTTYNESDSMSITGIRAHFAIKQGIRNRKIENHLDVVITPCRITGESVFEWDSKVYNANTKTAMLVAPPPPLDESNPCPDVCP